MSKRVARTFKKNNNELSTLYNVYENTIIKNIGAAQRLLPGLVTLVDLPSDPVS